ncbi:putative response regulator and transcription factor RR-A-type family [Helianthus debilis subsp. tardiflorus]
MVCTADDLLGWKDFPKGLRVLLLNDDISSATDIRSKLEEMDYVVSTFGNENEALSAISDNSRVFHVAIVEVRADNKDGRFKFLESTKDLPTIITSDVNCISTMMKCIALGAVEFLQKPLSEDKLRNIWQHVAHKAFNAGLKDQFEPMKSEKASYGSDLDDRLKEEDVKEDFSQNQEHASIDDRCHQDQAHISTEKVCVDHGGESKFVETACDDLVVDTITIETDTSTSLEEGIGKPLSNESCPDHTNNKKLNEASKHPNSCPTKSSRRKMKVDWTSELHKKFVQAVKQLGVDQAIPSRILELMNVPRLTRHNVSSHLQKYRLHRRHILPKESARKWPQIGHSTPRNYYLQKPVMAYPPPYPSNHPQVYPAWPRPPQMYYPGWQSSGNWTWNPCSGVQAEAWGRPAIPLPCTSFPQGAAQFQTRNSICQAIPKNSFDNYPGDEVIDKVVKEAINNPWLPLPLDLRPPSTESVIYELLKQGISTVPHQTNGSHSC